MNVTQIETTQKFVVPVVYVQPSFEELVGRFPDYYIGPDYVGAKRFDPIERCKAVSKENREVVFEYVHMDRGTMDRDASTDEVLAEMSRKGLRPALYEELLGFSEKYPNEQLVHSIVALGSVTNLHGECFVAYLCGAAGRQLLDLDWFDFEWRPDFRFLAVRE